jgi:hypothetical protein
LGSTYKINSTSLVSTLENGFVSTTDHTVSVNETNRQITITPTSSAFQIVSGGILRSYTGAQTSTAWNNTTGSKFVYFDSSGVLTTAEVAWTLQADEAPVAYIYWDATAGSAPILLLEDHPNTWSQAEWLHHHQVFGARWISGLTNYNNAITTGSPNSDGRNTCIGMSGGVIADEALRHTVQNSVAGGNWQQDLGPTSTSITTSNGASMKVVYWNGVRWVRTTTNGRFPFLWNSGTNRPEYVTSGGTVTTVADDQFFAYFVCISGDWRTGQQVYLIPFNTTYSSLAAAQAGASFNALAASLGSLPAPEIVVAHRLIFNTNYSGGGTYDAAVKYTRLNEVLDLRPYSFAQLNSINTVPGSHASTHLTGGADLLALPDSVRIAIDGQRFAIGAGAFVNLPMNYNATVTGWRLFNIARVGASDQISIEVRKCTYADYGASHPVTGDKISASAPITLASAGDYKNADTTLTGWTTAITSGDILQFYVNSATDITSVVVELQLTRA